MPRNPRISKINPCTALKDEKVARLLKPYVKRTRKYAARQLRLIKEECGGIKRNDKLYQIVFPKEGTSIGDNDDDKYMNCIWVGCHAIPSMKNLHIHVISKDFVSRHMETIHRYLVFTTPFFLKFNLEDLDNENTCLDPMDDPELRKVVNEKSYKDIPKCMTCGTILDGGIEQLKVHLEMEFKAWLAH